MYQSYDAGAVQRLCGITADDAPDLLIVHGTYNMPNKVDAWLAREDIANGRRAGHMFNLALAEVDGHTVWYAPVLGAALAAMVVHCACVMDAGRGNLRIVQIGTFGGTRRGARAGDLLVVTGAERGEAASDWYLPEGEPAVPDEALTEALREKLRARELTWAEGTVYTTPAFMAERWEDILRWEAAGHAGVEMEAATTFAIAQHFGVPACCLLSLIDNLIERQDIGAMSNETLAVLRAKRAVLLGVAMEMASA